jgi:hypothetical protein
MHCRVVEENLPHHVIEEDLHRCAAHIPVDQMFVTEMYPCDVTLDLDTACLKITHSRSGITITLCLQCVACPETEFEWEPLFSYFEAFLV